MAKIKFASPDDCRKYLRDNGYRRLQSSAVGAPEYWWKAGAAAEVAVSCVFTYPVLSRGYQEASDLALRQRMDAFWEFYGTASKAEKPLPFLPGTEIPAPERRQKITADGKKRCFNGHILHSKNVRATGECSVCRSITDRAYVRRKQDIAAWNAFGQQAAAP